MANTTTATELQVKKYLSDFYREFVAKNRFSKYTGQSNNNVIVIKSGKKQIEIPLVTRLKGDGVSGSNTLRGNGEKIGNYGLTLTPIYKRHAVEFDKEENDKPAFSFMTAARPLLMDWAMEKVRDEMIEGFGSIYNGTTYANYGDATNAAMDTWLQNNADRVLYGAAISNAGTAGAEDHADGLATLDTTADKLTAAIVSLAKRRAQVADAHIRPLKAEEDDNRFVMFCDTFAFKQLKEDSVITQAQREVQGKGGPLFTGGDLLWDNVIVREIPEIASLIDDSAGAWGAGATANSLKTGGSGSGRVGVSFLCGQQALSYGLGQRPNIITDNLYDYGFQPGVAVELKHEIRKSFFNNKQHGVVTVFTASPIDA